MSNYARHAGGRPLEPAKVDPVALRRNSVANAHLQATAVATRNLIDKSVTRDKQNVSFVTIVGSNFDVAAHSGIIITYTNTGVFAALKGSAPPWVRWKESTDSGATWSPYTEWQAPIQMIGTYTYVDDADPSQLKLVFWPQDKDGFSVVCNYCAEEESHFIAFNRRTITATIHLEVYRESVIN